MENQINICRERLHKELKMSKYNKERILKLSQELDQLIVKYYIRGDRNYVKKSI